jgi:LPXTG-motif cell wall-anchored protein
MKKMKKIFALLIAMVMVLGMSTSVFAAGTNEITVTGTIKDETYKLYKMFDLVVDDQDNPTAFKYTVATAWKTFFTTGAGKDYVTINATNGHVEWVSGKDTEADMIKLAQDAASYAASLTADGTEVASDTTVKFTGLDNGYYLITSTLGTKAMIDSTPTKPTQTITEKNPKDTIEKKVQEDSNSAWGTSNDAQVGDTVHFKSIAKVEPYTRNVYIHDTMDSGLTFTNGSIKVYVGNDSTETELNSEYYEILSTAQEGDTFTIQIKDSYITTLSETTYLTVTYDAVLNEKAISSTPAIVDQKNKTTITYGDKQSVNSETTTTTRKFEIKKHNSSDTVLAGAHFKLYIKTADAVEANDAEGIEAKDATYDEVKVIKIDDNNYRVATANETANAVEIITVASGNIVVWGVDSDTYYLEETVAPDGYNLLADKQEVTVAAANNTVADVLNQTGAELPSTGGIGTTIFYIIGAILVIGAGVVLVTRRRMNAQ